MSSTLLHFGEKVNRVLEDAGRKMRIFALLPSDPKALHALLDGYDHALGPSLTELLREQAASEGRFVTTGYHDTIIVREAAKLTSAAFSAETQAVLEAATGPAGGGGGSGAGSSATVDRMVDTFSEMRKLISGRMELGDASRTADERQLKIQERIDRAEHRAAVMVESLEAARVTRQAELGEISALVSKLSAEVAEVKARGSENEAQLTTFTVGQVAGLTTAHGGKVRFLA